MTEALQDLGEMIAAAQSDAVLSHDVANDELTLKLVIERWQREAAPAGSSDADLFPSFD